jgi:DNA-binding transcriptional ArsR family regulator
MNNNFISSFTPSLMSPATLEAIFVQRHKLVEHLIELVENSTKTANKHFRLLIGMRGIGKTHIIALIYYRLKATEDLQDKLLIAWLKEEEWGVNSWLDLLLRIFQALKIEYPALYQTKLQARIEALYELPTEDATPAGEKILKEFIADKTLLLLTENLDEIFNGLGNLGQKQFRAYLQNNNLITIIATSQSLFSGVSNKNSPFYGFFAPQYLDKLTIEEATSLLTKIAQLQQNTELESFIKSATGKDRIKAIHHLAGGNHRVYIIFSQFLTPNSLDKLVKPVMQTLDELTPYYQARMQWLSPQQRKIIELLCDKANALPVKEIAQRCFITHQTASSQLKDLREKGYVTANSVGRESFYELLEPLMRICLAVKKQRGEPIKLFINFLRIWYTEKELKIRELLSNNCLEREFINIEELETEDPTEYIQLIWDSTKDINTWKFRLQTLVEIYNKYQVVSSLSKGIVDNIPNLMSEMVSDKLARTWLKIWQEIAGNKPELAIALRLLKTAVEYKETKGDRRILLQLAKEEREILESLLDSVQ